MKEIKEKNDKYIHKKNVEKIDKFIETFQKEKEDKRPLDPKKIKH